MSAPLPAAAMCSYCGLPLPGGPWHEAPPVSAEAGVPLEYCCLGCRIAAEVTGESGDRGEATWTLTKLGLAVFFTMNVLICSMLLWSHDVYVPESANPLAKSLDDLCRHACLLLSLPVLFILGGRFWAGALGGIRRGVLSVDFLILSGVGAAYVFSAVSVFRGSGPIYFEVGCLVLVLATLGRWFEATARVRAASALDALAKLLPDTVRVIEAGQESERPLAQVRVGDSLRVRAGERFPVDGRLLSPLLTVDEQLLTGESWPVEKRVGEPILGGTLNVDGDALLQATETAAEGTFQRLLDAVRDARAQKGPIERAADRATAWFTPLVAIVALLAGIIPAANGDPARGLLSALSVVLIACPCALGLATPLALWAALGRAAGAHVLFRSGDALERLAAVKAFAFDKTGTLTTGKATLERTVVAERRSAGEVLAHAAALARASTHPLSSAIVRRAGGAGAEPLHEIRIEPGLGIRGSRASDNQPVLLGNLRYMQSANLRLSPRLTAAQIAAEVAGKPLALVGWEGAVQGLFVFDEQLRGEAGPALEALRAAGYQVEVLTGDHAGRGNRLAAALGVPVAVGLLPAGKVQEIRRMCRQFGRVAMVGDGINDAPPLAASDVGISLGSGTDIARDSAAVCILSDDLLKIPWALGLARRTVATIRLNLIWAFGYNGIGVFLAAFGWLNPVVAAILMAGSSLLVILNSLRLLNTPFPRAAADARPATAHASQSAVEPAGGNLEPATLDSPPEFASVPELAAAGEERRA